MFCKKCGHERVNGEKFCPICGTPFPVDENTKDENFPAKNEASPLQKDSEEQKPSEPVVQYCKKCGTKQENGMKFCPVCGEPYLDENGKPYLKGRQKDIADAKEKVKSTISDLSDKGKNIADNIGEKISTATSEGQKQVKEKVLPQISQVVTQAKETDWEEQAKNGKEKADAFLNDSAMTTKWAKITAVAATVLFFVINGFNSIWLWYVILIIMLLIAFLPQKGQNEAEVAAKHKKIFIATACLAGCLIFLGPIRASDSNSSDTDEASYTEGDESNDNGSSAEETESTSDAEPVIFNTPADVIGYLSGKGFTYNGHTLRIRTDGISIDDQQLTGAIEVTECSGTQAVITASSPYSGSQNTVVVDSSTGTVTDKDGTVFTLSN